MIASGPTKSAHQSSAVSQRSKVVVAAVGLATAARMARDRGTHERVIVLAIAVAAAIGLARAGQVRSITRLIEWDRRRILAEQRRAKALRS